MKTTPNSIFLLAIWSFTLTNSIFEGQSPKNCTTNQTEKGFICKPQKQEGKPTKSKRGEHDVYKSFPSLVCLILKETQTYIWLDFFFFNLLLL